MNILLDELRVISAKSGSENRFNENEVGSAASKEDDDVDTTKHHSHSE